MANVMTTSLVFTFRNVDEIKMNDVKNGRVFNYDVPVTIGWGQHKKTVWHRLTFWERIIARLEPYLADGLQIMVDLETDDPNAWISDKEARAKNSHTVVNFRFIGGGKGVDESADTHDEDEEEEQEEAPAKPAAKAPAKRKLKV